MTLLRLAQAGDRDAFGQLYIGYAPHVTRYVAARLRDRDPDAAPDLVQDTFTAALTELDSAHEDVEGWLIQLAAKMCTRHTWGQRRYLRAALSTGEQQQLAATGDPVLVANPATRARIATGLAGLDPAERMTLQLRYLDGLTQQNAAQVMGCSTWTVKRRQQQGLRQLAAQLGTHPAGPAPITAIRA